jgi:hypothetical protein
MKELEIQASEAKRHENKSSVERIRDEHEPLSEMHRRPKG